MYVTCEKTLTMTYFKKYLPALAALMLMSACDIRHDYHVYDEASYQRMIDEKDEGSMVPASSEGTCTPAPMQEMPLSKTYLMGVLDNGLSYYVHRYGENEFREGIVDMELVLKVGSLVEEEDERGVAHYVEHMVFGGTKHFPDNAAMNTMRRHGVAFGDDLNAQTQFVSTYYQLYGVPVGADPLMVDTCLLLLRDWISECTMDDQIVERERSVIIEEIKTREADNYLTRARDIWAGTRYSDRMPVGCVESVSGISGDVIRRFYRKWYQPQNMAVIVYGDIEPEKIEKKIREIFAGLERGETVVPHYDFAMPPHQKPRAFAYRSKTPVNAEVLMTYSIADDSKNTPRNTLTHYVATETRRRLKTLIRNRLNHIRTELPLFDFGFDDYDDGVIEDFPFTIDLRMEPANWQLVVQLVSAELEKIHRYGVTEKEARYAGLSVTGGLEMDSISWKEEGSDYYKYESYFGMSVPRNHFLYGDFLVDYPTNQQLTSYCSRISTGYAMSCLKQFTADSRLTLSVTLPEGVDVPLPDSKQIVAAYEDGRKAALESEKYRYAEDPNYLRIAHEIALDRQPGELKERTQNFFGDKTHLTLTNGVEVDLIYCGYSDFELNGVRYGAMSHYDGTDITKIWMLPIVAAQPCAAEVMGYKLTFDEYDAFEMRASKMCGEDMLKLAVFSLCNTEIDSVRLERYKQVLRSKQPASQSVVGHLDDLWRRELWNETYGSRVVEMTPEEIDAITLDEMRRLSEDYRSNFNGMHFTIRTSYKKSYIEPLVIKYLGMLPSKPEAVSLRDLPAFHFKNESGRSTYPFTTQQPIAYVISGYAQEKDYVYSIEQHVLMEAFTQVLREQLVNQIRLSEGNVYTFQVLAQHNFLGADKQSFSVYTPCDPEAVEWMLGAIDRVVHEMADGDLITQPMVDNYIHNRMKTYCKYPEIGNYVEYMTNLDKCNGRPYHTQDKRAIKGVTPSKLRRFAQTLISKGYKHELAIVGQQE